MSLAANERPRYSTWLTTPSETDTEYTVWSSVFSSLRSTNTLDNSVSSQQPFCSPNSAILWGSPLIKDYTTAMSAIIDRVLFNIGNHEMLGDYVKVQGGYAFKSSEFKEYGVPVIRISNLPQDSIYVDLKDCVYYDSGDYSNYVISNDMLLIAMSGATTGKTAIYSNQFIAYLNQRVGCFRNIKHIYYPYLYVLVESKLFKNQLSSKLIAGAQPNISSSDLESILLPFPCIELQQEIADSIKSVNKKINCEEKLMSLYTENKTYLLQQMFI